MEIESETKDSEINLDVLLNVPVALSVEVGRTAMTIGELLETGEGSVVKLSRLIDEPLDILVNDAPIAQGVVVMQDDKFGIQITDIISPHERARNLQQREESEAGEQAPETEASAETAQSEAVVDAPEDVEAAAVDAPDDVEAAAVDATDDAEAAEEPDGS